VTAEERIFNRADPEKAGELAARSENIARALAAMTEVDLGVGCA